MEIKLKESQKVGFNALLVEVNAARARLEEFVILCLREGGGNPGPDERWIWDEPNLQWVKDEIADQSGQAAEGASGPKLVKGQRARQD